MSNTNIRSKTPSHERVVARRKTSSTVITKVNDYIVPALKESPALCVSFYCLYVFYTECYQEESQSGYSLIFVAFLATFANAFAGMPMFKDESFLEFRILLDYAQEILPLPCVCTEIWIKYEMASFWLNYLHAALGFFTFLFYVIYEVKRIDLTDLTILINAMSLVVAGSLNENVYAVLAALICFGYYYFKRRKEECYLKNTALFNSVMIAFNAMVLLSFEPKSLLPEFLTPPAETPPTPKSKSSILSLISSPEEEPAGKHKKKGKAKKARMERMGLLHPKI